MNAKVNRCEDEIDAIRDKIYEETKHLTREENNKRLDELGKLLSAKYGFKIVQSAKTSITAEQY